MYSVTQTWRWGSWIPTALGGVVFFLVLFGYHPPPRPVAVDETKAEILARIDYIGGILSIAGIGLFMLGLQWGGYT
jgi:Fungal trichothecene efflux pump (TRI12)